LADCHVKELVPTPYTVLGAAKVMPLFPPQSPRRVPLMGAAAPATVMSMKSTSVIAASVAMVSVIGTPSVPLPPARSLDEKNKRLYGCSGGLTVRVPLIVMLVKTTSPVCVAAGNVMLLKVTVPVYPLPMYNELPPP